MCIFEVFSKPPTLLPMVKILAIASIGICLLAIAVSVWVFIETKGRPWPKKKKQE
jgi:hypothetical protein